MALAEVDKAMDQNSDNDDLMDDLNEEISEYEITDITGATTNPDEFYAKQAFRVVYQTNNFLVPQIAHLIGAGQIVNIRPEYQRRLKVDEPAEVQIDRVTAAKCPRASCFLLRG